MFLEEDPSLGCRWLVVPLASIACEDGRPRDDDEADIDQLSWRFDSVGCIRHVGVLGDGSE